MRGRAFCGYCAAKEEPFSGWRPHLIRTTAGVPLACDLVPGGLHDLTPIHELTDGLPRGATVYGDKGYNAADDEATILADTGVRLGPRPAPERVGGQAGPAGIPQAHRGAVQPV